MKNTLPRSQYVDILDDNSLTLPPQAYVRMDHRLVKKEKGKFVCVASPEGWHGDTFDANKLAIHALKGIGSATKFLPPTGKRAEILTDRQSRAVLA
jgi:hypothetical protein